jgi:outer membrane immunogenic protein
MNIARILGFLALGTALITTAAQAADMYTPDPVIDYAVPFSWEGFYAGVGVGGGFFSRGALNARHGYVDLVLGANGVTDDILYGVEVTAGGTWINGVWRGLDMGSEARLGYIFIPEAVIYGAVGGFAYGGGAVYGYLGAGVEYAVTDNISIDFEYKYYGLSNNGWRAHVATAQALWHF